ncbi:hypothetical protein RhiirC2_800532 [Rhizophagus irregularis]|uniref:Endonuclease/exonuclease/phosphatase domain-containing protein n=1 Tax=Rhizophagus irregularis TaxID=588596 RepID=A0A2N1M3J5_9GLOM|nr:hypothetical protein RhiirC2_800532 [Rhizophagus irregularis]
MDDNEFDSHNFSPPVYKVNPTDLLNCAHWNVRVFLLGDLNCSIDNRFSSSAKNLRLLQYLHTNHFVDCYALDPITELPLPTHFYKSNGIDLSSRIDYIWLSPSLPFTLLSVDTVDKDSPVQISDHSPISVLLDGTCISHAISKARKKHKQQHRTVISHKAATPAMWESFTTTINLELCNLPSLDLDSLWIKLKKTLSKAARSHLPVRKVYTSRLDKYPAPIVSLISSMRAVDSINVKLHGNPIVVGSNWTNISSHLIHINSNLSPLLMIWYYHHYFLRMSILDLIYEKCLKDSKDIFILF